MPGLEDLEGFTEDGKDDDEEDIPDYDEVQDSANYANLWAFFKYSFRLCDFYDFIIYISLSNIVISIQQQNCMTT